MTYVDQRQLLTLKLLYQKGHIFVRLLLMLVRKIGVPATMTSLTRTMGSGITQEDAITLESLKHYHVKNYCNILYPFKIYSRGQ